MAQAARRKEKKANAPKAAGKKAGGRKDKAARPSKGGATQPGLWWESRRARPAS
eukprot:gene39560-16663_t